MTGLSAKSEDGHVVPGITLGCLKGRLSKVQGALVECPLVWPIHLFCFRISLDSKGLPHRWQGFRWLAHLWSYPSHLSLRLRSKKVCSIVVHECKWDIHALKHGWWLLFHHVIEPYFLFLLVGHDTLSLCRIKGSRTIIHFDECSLHDSTKGRIKCQSPKAVFLSGGTFIRLVHCTETILPLSQCLLNSVVRVADSLYTTLASFDWKSVSLFEKVSVWLRIAQRYETHRLSFASTAAPSLY